jgi:hypothetical protein
VGIGIGRVCDRTTGIPTPKVELPEMAQWASYCSTARAEHEEPATIEQVARSPISVAVAVMDAVTEMVEWAAQWAVAPAVHVELPDGEHATPRLAFPAIVVDAVTAMDVATPLLATPEVAAEELAAIEDATPRLAVAAADVDAEARIVVAATKAAVILAETDELAVMLALAA